MNSIISNLKNLLSTAQSSEQQISDSAQQCQFLDGSLRSNPQEYEALETDLEHVGVWLSLTSGGQCYLRGQASDIFWWIRRSRVLARSMINIGQSTLRSGEDLVRLEYHPPVTYTTPCPSPVDIFSCLATASSSVAQPWSCLPRIATAMALWKAPAKAGWKSRFTFDRLSERYIHRDRCELWCTLGQRSRDLVDVLAFQQVLSVIFALYYPR